MSKLLRNSSYQDAMLVDHQAPRTYSHRHVITSFICNLPGDSFKDFKVSIFKRSDQTPTHQRLWSGCSGYIDASDPDPLASAWRELEEETGLTPDDLDLLHAGKPHNVFATDLSRRWTIHPFAFVLKPNARPIKLNWENIEIRFVDPEKVETYDTVPDLDITLWRTLVGPDTARGLRDLREDHSSGARSLATKAVRVLLMSVTGTDLDWSSNVVSFWRAFRLVAWHLAVNGRPAMGAAIERAVLRCVADASPIMANVKTVEDAKTTLIDACMNTLNERLSGRGLVAQQFVNHLSTLIDPDCRHEVTFLTLSMSCAKLCVLEFARQIKNKRIHIIIMESRPRFEGVTMAVDLERKIHEMLADEEDEQAEPERNGSSKGGSKPPKRVRVTLGVDAAVGVLAHSVDYVVLGSDRINHCGDVSNKVGSLTAVLAARAISKRHVEVIAVAEREKIARLGGNLGDISEDHDYTELSDAWPLNMVSREHLLNSDYIKVSNPYFEWVPSEHIDAYITETGMLKRADIAKESAAAAGEWDAVFSDL